MIQCFKAHSLLDIGDLALVEAQLVTMIIIADNPFPVSTSPAGPSITISGLDATIDKGESDKFTVTAKLGQDTTGIFLITVLVTGGSGISFNSGCSSTNSITRVPAGVTSHTATLTLHGCAAPGGTVTARLIRGTTIATASQSVTVVDPPVVEFDDPPSILYSGEQATLSVEAENIPMTGAYEIKATAYGAEDGESSSHDSDIGFNLSCSDVEESADVTAGATTHTATFTLHACDFENNGGGVVTVALLDGNDNVIAVDWFYVEVKPITVIITADNPFPVTTGTTKEREVELTANVDAPDAATFSYFHWQTSPPNNSDCTSVQNATSETYDFSPAPTAPATKSARVIVKVNKDDAVCYISETVYITWDLGKTLREITTALSANMEATQSSPGGISGQVPTLPKPFIAKETDLLKCVETTPSLLGGGTRYNSFAHLMTQYTGKTKTLLDSGGCRVQANEAWTTLTTAFTTTFTGLERDAQNNLTPAGQFLETPSGTAYKKHMLSRNALSDQFSEILAPTVQRLHNEPTTLPWEHTGNGLPDIATGCMRHVGVDTTNPNNERDLDKRLAVVNCLVFDVPHSIWIDIAEEIYDANQAIVTEYQRTVLATEWLDHDDWECTQVTDHLSLTNPVQLRYFTAFGDTVKDQAACQKHDIAWHSLARLTGIDDPSRKPAFQREHRTAIDAMWHPRNKVLADYVAFIDTICPGPSKAERLACFEDPGHLLLFINATLNPSDELKEEEKKAQQAVFAFGIWNDKNWPTSREDLDHAIARQEYIECSNPLAEPLNLRLRRIGNSIYAYWSVQEGCSSTSVQDAMEICIDSRDLPDACVTLGSGGVLRQYRLRALGLSFLQPIPESLSITKVQLKLSYPLSGFGREVYDLYFTAHGDFTYNGGGIGEATKPRLFEVEDA